MTPLYIVFVIAAVAMFIPALYVLLGPLGAKTVGGLTRWARRNALTMEAALKEGMHGELGREGKGLPRRSEAGGRPVAGENRVSEKSGSHVREYRSVAHRFGEAEVITGDEIGVDLGGHRSGNDTPAEAEAAGSASE